MNISVNTQNGVKNIKVYRPYSFTLGDGKLGRLTLMINRWITEKCIKRHNINPDVVYAHFWTAGYNILSYVKKKRLPFFVIIGEDVINIQNDIAQWEIDDYCDNVTGVICVSTKNQKESVNLGLTKIDKTIVIPML